MKATLDGPDGGSERSARYYHPSDRWYRMSRHGDDSDLPRKGLTPEPDERAIIECRDCGARFPRSEVATPEKGQLACPECDSGDVTAVE